MALYVLSLLVLFVFKKLIHGVRVRRLVARILVGQRVKHVLLLELHEEALIVIKEHFAHDTVPLD